MNLFSMRVYYKCMNEESKEEYLARHKKELGIIAPDDELEQEDDIENKPTGLKAKLKSLFFLLLSALFLYFIYQVFGMFKSN